MLRAHRMLGVCHRKTVRFCGQRDSDMALLVSFCVRIWLTTLQLLR